MLLVFGQTYDFERIRPVEMDCPNCGERPIGLYYAHKKLTVYWIPTVTQETSYALGCEACGQHWLVDEEVVQTLPSPVEQDTEGFARSDPRSVRSSPELSPPEFILEGSPDSGSGAPVAEAPRMTGTLCSRCGAPHVAGSPVCTECGAPVANPGSSGGTCPSCGAAYTSGSFCIQCGAELAPDR